MTGAVVIDFAYERQRHVAGVGRADLLARLDRQLIEDTAQRWVAVTGGPGIGKSAVLAAWLARRRLSGCPAFGRISDKRGSVLVWPDGHFSDGVP